MIFLDLHMSYDLILLDLQIGTIKFNATLISVPRSFPSLSCSLMNLFPEFQSMSI